VSTRRFTHRLCGMQSRRRDRANTLTATAISIIRSIHVCAVSVKRCGSGTGLLVGVWETVSPFATENGTGVGIRIMVRGITGSNCRRRRTVRDGSCGAAASPPARRLANVITQLVDPPSDGHRTDARRVADGCSPRSGPVVGCLTRRTPEVMRFRRADGPLPDGREYRDGG